MLPERQVVWPPPGLETIPEHQSIGSSATVSPSSTATAANTTDIAHGLQSRDLPTQIPTAAVYPPFPVPAPITIEGSPIPVVPASYIPFAESTEHPALLLRQHITESSLLPIIINPNRSPPENSARPIVSLCPIRPQSASRTVDATALTLPPIRTPRRD